MVTTDHQNSITIAKNMQKKKYIYLPKGQKRPGQTVWEMLVLIIVVLVLGLVWQQLILILWQGKIQSQKARNTETNEHEKVIKPDTTQP